VLFSRFLASGSSGYRAQAMDRARLPDPDIRIDGARVRASSYLAYAGAYQLTLGEAAKSGSPGGGPSVRRRSSHSRTARVAAGVSSTVRRRLPLP